MDLNKKQVWKRLAEFIQEEAKVYEEISLVEKSSQPEKPRDGSSTSGEYKKSYNTESNLEENTLKCVLCGKTDHVVTIDHFGRKVVQYFSCKVFSQMTPKERFKLLLEKGLYYQCLSPGASIERGKHKTALCYSKFICKHKSHLRYPRKKHILLCEDHKNDPENYSLLEKYRKEHILSLKSHLPEFSKNIKLSFHCDIPERLDESYLANQCDEEITESSVYILQTISINEKGLTFSLIQVVGI